LGLEARQRIVRFRCSWLELVASGVPGTKRDFEDLEDDEEEELYPSKKVSN